MTLYYVDTFCWENILVWPDTIDQAWLKAFYFQVIDKSINNVKDTLYANPGTSVSLSLCALVAVELPSQFDPWVLNREHPGIKAPPLAVGIC